MVTIFRPLIVRCTTADTRAAANLESWMTKINLFTGSLRGVRDLWVAVVRPESLAGSVDPWDTSQMWRFAHVLGYCVPADARLLASPEQPTKSSLRVEYTEGEPNQ